MRDNIINEILLLPTEGAAVTMKTGFFSFFSVPPIL